MNDTHEIREAVRERYARAAKEVVSGENACCGDKVIDVDDVRFGLKTYDSGSLEGLPDATLLASLGCGNPTAVAELREGETVLDLGSGGGIDVLLSAKRVGPSGLAYGLDMTDEMLELARRNQEEAGIGNARFLKGYMEDIPLPDAEVHVIISNCVVNLSADKAKVLAEMFRVLKPGGRLGITDIVSSDELSPQQRAERGSFTGCIAGALSFDEYGRGLSAAGFEGISVEPTHEVVDGMFAAIVKASKPA